MAADVFKILRDLELKAVGLNPQNNAMQEGYFTSFRDIGLPITAEDFANPWAPSGSNMDQPTTQANATDPKNAGKTASSQMDEDKVATAGISASMQAFLNTFLLIDDKLQMNNDYAVIPASSKVSDSWEAIVTGANGIPLNQTLSAAMQQAYATARAVLQDVNGDPTPHFNIYKQYEEAYNSKVKAYQRAYADAFTSPAKLQNWPIDGVSYQNDVTDAANDWSSLGFKIEIETAMATLSSVGTDPAMVLISQSKYRFTNSLVNFANIGDIPYTIMLPGTWYDKDNDDGWNEYTSEDFQTESHYQESSTAYSTGGDFSVGFWSAGSSFTESHAQSSLNIQTNNLDISFSYCVVDIERPWLDTTLLNLSNWFIFGNYKKNCISNGTMGQVYNPADPSAFEPLFLPSLVTSLILIKNLTIKWDNYQADWQNSQSSLSVGVSVGWGPFAVNGSYSHHDASRDFTCTDNGEGLFIEGVQVIGYVSAINPPSPATDSAPYMSASTQSVKGSHS